MVWCSQWLSGPAGPGLSSGSWLVLFPFPVRCSWRLTSKWDSVVRCRRRRLLKRPVESTPVLQGLERLCFFGERKKKSVGFYFEISVPVLEGVTVPTGRSRVSRKNSPELRVILRPSTMFFFPYCPRLSFFILHIVTALLPTPGWKKMSFLFYCIKTALWFSHVEQNELQCPEC